MTLPISRTSLSYTGLGSGSGDSVQLTYNFAFGIPEFATLTVYEENNPDQLLDFELVPAGLINVFNRDPSTSDPVGAPASGNMVLELGVPADEFVRSIENGNIFKEETLQDLFTQTFIVTGAVAEGRLSTLTQDLDLGGFNLNNVGDSEIATDGINRGELDTEVATLNVAIAGIIAGMIPDGDYGDITVSGAGTVWSLDDDTITQAKMATNSVGTDEIIDLAVTEGKIGELAVSNSKITATAISTSKIEDNAVGVAKMAQEGTVGQVLTSNGAGSDVSYQDAVGGAWELISSATASASTSIDFTSGITDEYSTFVVIFDRLKFSGIQDVFIRLSHDGGSSFYSGNLHSAQGNYRFTANSYAREINQNGFILTPITNPQTAWPVSGMVELYGLTEVNFNTFQSRLHAIDSTSNSDRSWQSSGGYFNSTAVVDAIQVVPQSGTITEGTAYLYGIRSA